MDVIEQDGQTQQLQEGAPSHILRRKCITYGDKVLSC